jgi:protein dithiol oxidoreductase (disulfide-forming)
MRLIQKVLFAVAALSFAAVGATASPAAPKAGVEYLVLPQAQPTDAGDKVEVTEFFTYSCPHCYGFDPVLAEWVKKNAGKIVFKRVHVAVNEGDAVLQRLFATTEAMDITEQTHSKVFDAVHPGRTRIQSDEAAFDWAEKAGLPRAKFIDTYRSFGMQARVNRLRNQTQAYRIEQWPMIAVGGKYMTSPYYAAQGTQPVPVETEQQKLALQVLDFLVAKAKAEKK